MRHPSQSLRWWKQIRARVSRQRPRERSCHLRKFKIAILRELLLVWFWNLLCMLQLSFPSFISQNHPLVNCVTEKSLVRRGLRKSQFYICVQMLVLKLSAKKRMAANKALQVGKYLLILELWTTLTTTTTTTTSQQTTTTYIEASNIFQNRFALYRYHLLAVR